MSSRRRGYKLVHQLAAEPFQYQALCGVRAGKAAQVVTADEFRKAMDRSFVGMPIPVGAVVRCANCSRIGRPS
jgi:hypothetical protein